MNSVCIWEGHLGVVECVVYFLISSHWKIALLCFSPFQIKVTLDSSPIISNSLEMHIFGLSLGVLVLFCGFF